MNSGERGASDGECDLNRISFSLCQLVSSHRAIDDYLIVRFYFGYDYCLFIDSTD
ncbi:MAG: hypothetical protein HFE53_05895 [Turicibacter sp.]|uniref:Uncharacterized protein n=1 Tax=Turicibacter faecis TaxID=2963365 RepID=A0ABM8II95_9FIRM|nr:MULTISPECIES: hypothetical protein [unclassified Turicibacter]MCI8701825.1 hypothetical protein [Turicibacter sp.]BEH90957.1 hypothetical protein T23_10590 [Turicibacter sp. TC023]